MHVHQQPLVLHVIHLSQFHQEHVQLLVQAVIITELDVNLSQLTVLMLPQQDVVDVTLDTPYHHQLLLVILVLLENYKFKISL